MIIILVNGNWYIDTLTRQDQHDQEEVQELKFQDVVPSESYIIKERMHHFGV